MSQFIDTNIFIRLLMQDDLAKAHQCRSLFADAKQGKAELHTSEAILAEVVYVLRSPVTYGLDRAQTATLLRPIVKSEELRIDHKDAILSAIDRFESHNLDFEDCLAIAHAVRAHAATSTATIGTLTRRRRSHASSRDVAVRALLRAEFPVP
jgi:predicted nucleic-acid-binding protein